MPYITDSRILDTSVTKERLLEKRVHRALQTDGDEKTIFPVRTDGPAPLSFAQQRLWFLDQLHPNSPLYNMTMAARLVGKLDISAFQHAISKIIHRHQILRTRFINIEGEPWQEVFETAAFQLPLEDLSTKSGGDCEKQVQLRLEEEARRPFNLSGDVLLRSVLFRISPEEHVLFVSIHHIASDAFSLGILFQEMACFYGAALVSQPPTLPELMIQYADYAAWQREESNKSSMREHLAYWKEQLADAPELLELPVDKPRPLVPSSSGGRRVRQLRPELVSALQKLAQSEGVTLFMLLLGAFQMFLHRLTGQRDVLVGIPIAGRHLLETERLIGFFINTLVTRSRPVGNPTFRELLKEVKTTTLKAYAHQELPFEKLVEELQPKRTTCYTPLIQTMFVLQTGLAQKIVLPELKVTLQEVGTGTAKFDLMLTMNHAGDALSAEMEYNSDLFNSTTIERWLGHFEMLLAGIARESDGRLNDFSMLNEEERRCILVEWNQTRKEYPRGISVPQVFEDKAARYPESIAVIDVNESLTYRELNERSNQLAHYLKRCGLQPEQCVGVYLERSVRMVVALLACLKAGGAYLPLDQSFPRKRLGFMLIDSKASMIITEEEFSHEFKECSARTICLDKEADEIAEESLTNPAPGSTGERLAYVIYTSGSTGKPKGVCTPHRAITRTVLNTDYVHLDQSIVMAQATNASFDAAIWEIWGALLNGARLVITPTEVLLSPRELQNHLQHHGITSLFLTTSLFHQLVSEVPSIFCGLRHLMVGGEAMEPKWAAEVLRNGPPQELLNGYGPTESTVFATCKLVCSVPAQVESIPIGRPIENTSTYVLDSNLQPVPIGVAGELYIGGDGLALGYLNQPELTAQKFIPNPFVPNPEARLYKTGDLACYLPDGNLEFLGRIDQQVKIRGFRIELGEIESTLLQHPAIRQCIVTVCPGAGGVKQLAGYLVCRQSHSASSLELQNFLKQRIPEFMVPAFFVFLGALPLTPNGKVDRPALPIPDASTGMSDEKLSPRNETERQLQLVWEEVLNMRPIGIQDKFFALGGHSLLAVRLLARIERKFGRKVSVSALFQNPSIEQVALLLRSHSSQTSGSAIVEIQRRGTKPPLMLVHGVGGGMFWGYNNLSHHLPEDQPVFAFKSRALDGKDEFEGIEVMATQYVEDLRAFQPYGPYYLGGYCFGGVVAYEMACQLLAKGEKVALLALINSTPPNSSYTRFRYTPAMILRFARNLCMRCGASLCSTPEKRREFFRWKMRSMIKGLRRILLPSGSGPEGKSIDDLLDLSQYTEQQQKLWQSHFRSLVNYRPPVYPGHVTLLRSPVHLLRCSFAPDYGWSEFSQKGVTVKIIPGAHETIIQEPHVKILGAELSTSLAESQALADRGKRLTPGTSM
ncbi:non-ribosomal peptide synthetase [Pedosphaera parvula]|uniref:non-ribosomal peptide synthetase n=1 Tax=Pedosphaera parvula TaxID=1032527 RepID=UPI0001734A7B|nr:non-ribosomal peptide synthetase [Pedosphaera parvula]